MENSIDFYCMRGNYGLVKYGGSLSAIQSRRSSGYESKEADWNAFINCNIAAIRNKYPSDEGDDLIMRHGSFIGDADKRVRMDEDELEKLQQRLKVKLPNSYVDFKREFNLPPEIVSERYNLRHDVFFSFDLVNYFPDSDRDFFEIISNYGGYNDVNNNVDYSLYGIEQASEFPLREHLRDLIIIGFLEGDLLALNPQVKTVDGEMEAIFIYSTGAYHAPSFAELMRQISYLETGYPNHVPPYSQDILKGSCADKIPLLNVWWK